MFYEGINFNTAWVAQASFKEFSKHEKHHGISEKRLREVHALCKAEQLLKNPPDLTGKKHKSPTGDA